MKYTKSECENKIAKWQKRLAESREDLIVGEWYHVNGMGLLVYNNDEPTYGFWSREFNVGYLFAKSNDTTLATKEEVRETLITEAKKRGLNFNYYYYCTEGVLKGMPLMSPYSGGVTLFNNGVWKDVTPTYTHKELVNLIGHDFFIK